VVEHLSSKCETLSSNPSTAKKKKKRKERNYYYHGSNYEIICVHSFKNADKGWEYSSVERTLAYMGLISRMAKKNQIEMETVHPCFHHLEKSTTLTFTTYIIWNFRFLQYLFCFLYNV
jgi:glutathione peroxidase-family protein